MSRVSTLPVKQNSEALTNARQTRARKALSFLSHEYIRPIIDTDKLVRSEIFAEMVDLAVAHARLHGNFEDMNRLLDVLSPGKHERALLNWFCSTAGAKVSVKNGRPHLSKSELPPTWQQPLATVFPSAVAAQQKAVAAAKHQAKLANPHTRVIEVLPDAYVDMLDSPARLPGSYGSGKRR